MVTLHRAGHSPGEIFRLLRSLGISRRFVYRAIDRYNETQGVDDRPRSGRPRSVRTPNLVRAVRSRIARNPLRKQKLMALEMGVDPRSMSRVLREDLGLRAYRRQTGHLLSTKLKQMRLIKCKRLKQRYAENLHRTILFTDEKIFTIEEKLNKQNDRVYASTSREAAQVVGKVQRGHHPASVMVWWGVSWKGVTKLHFCENGVKTSAVVYQNQVLDKVVRPLGEEMFNGEHWVYQQDSAPAHKARSTQAWLSENVPEFIAAQDWPSASPDLNPLDYRLWSELEAMACRTRHPSLDSLKRALVKAVASFPMDKVRAAIDDWPRRLEACVKSKGGHFE